MYFDAAVWTVCAKEPAAFTRPPPPLSEITDGYGLARSGEWLAAGGFDFGRWNFERGCARLVARHDLGYRPAACLVACLVQGQVIRAQTLKTAALPVSR